MRHKFPYRQLGRSPKHRKAMMRNLAAALIRHDRIVTTVAKAKEMRPYMERLVHKAKRLNSNDHIKLKTFVRQGKEI